MPRVSFTQTFKNAGEVEKFPEYKLRIGEKSRAWLPDDPWMEWYHRIEAPVIDHGEVQMEVKDTKRGPKEVPKMDWIGSAFCIGETGTPEEPGPLMLEGIDPANCPVCESAANNTGVRTPEQRFAAPIIKYKVRGRGQNPYELAVPTSAEVLVWAYTGRIHGMLHDLAAREEAALRKLDITVDLEDTPGADTYQKIKALAAIRNPAWRDPKVKEYIRELWFAQEENRPTDEQLRVACKGRDYPRAVLMDMVRRAESQYRDAERAGGSGGDMGAADAGFNGSLSENIDALLTDEPAQNGTPGVADTDPWDDDVASHPGGTEEFASDEQRAAVADAKADVQREVAAIVDPDPFAQDEDDQAARAQADPTASGATTTSTAAPAAGSRSRTAQKSANGASASSDPDMLSDLESSTAPFGDAETGTAGQESAGSGSGGSPADAARDRAVQEAADGMFGPSEGVSEPPAPEQPAARRKASGKSAKAKAAPAAEPAATPAEPVPAGAPSGNKVIDFDDLWSED